MELSKDEYEMMLILENKQKKLSPDICDDVDIGEYAKKIVLRHGAVGSLMHQGRDHSCQSQPEKIPSHP